MKARVLHLLGKKTFLPLFLTQFFGAFNDNAYKLAMLTLISYFLSTSQGQSEQFQAIAGALFILPFFILSATAGQLADKIDKAKMTRVLKVFELMLMIVGGVGLYYGNIPLMMLTLTGMGVHSTFFGPIKYAILPDHLPNGQLLAATSLIEGSTFLAILFGTTLGALGVGGERSGVLYAVLLTCSSALIGLFASHFIPPARSKDSNINVDWRLIRATNRMIRDIVRNTKIVPALFAISWFWLIGAVILTKLPDYSNYVLNAETTVFAVFLALFSIGIAAGSLAINKILEGEVSLRLVPKAMLLLSVFACDLYWATPNQSKTMLSLTEFFLDIQHIRISLDLFFLAFSGGLFIVPLYTFLQVSSEGTHRARTIAANNIFNAFFMVLGSLFVMLLIYLKVPIPGVFLTLGILNVFAAGIFWIYFRK
ncbi:MFS transporter [Legionella impletisoli]|uniref:2-acyl-glycerophospho-ethanolamine acyltransferase n=1 Tax=Legionella impletisoli TaxID=343510 RepID=A0A917JQC1_9GAMM|nr:MFS transporter [Legionella impletisoli]GGI81288.1 2-acyl-glycerophospho-ethanolamine acyltransferase [Legionella impletisoli]